MNAQAGATRVLVIEDDAVLGGALVQRLRLEGLRPQLVGSCAQALQALRRDPPDFVLADIRLPDGSGEDCYRQALPHLGRTPIIFMTAHADLQQAVRLVRAGADDYLTKPFDIEVLLDRIRELATPPTTGAESAPRLGLSPATGRLAADIERLAKVNTPVLLRGETGVGKEVAAKMLHALSRQPDAPFVAVNCAAIPSELMESQFFGHERGAFTGALQQHVGYFEEAGEGTLFLDEVGELPARLQGALLRVLEDGGFRRVGGRSDLRFRGRIVAATNADLQQRIAAREFREDLYYRLAVVELHVPPLRERKDEIVPLAEILLRRACVAMGIPVPALDDSAIAACKAHRWPGNVRELRNRLERALALTESGILRAADIFPEYTLDAPPHRGSLADARAQAELESIEQALEASGGRIAEAAHQLGISRTTLWKRRRDLRRS